MAIPHLIVDLVLAVSAAFVGGAIAQRFGQPALLGYLLAGVAIGPFTPGPVADTHAVQTLAEIGVAFLMFAVGAELSLGEFRRLGKLAAMGGALQILITMGLGLALALALGLTGSQGLYFGALIALSSTVVALKLLLARDETRSLHGRIALGLLVAQDIAVLPMAIILPTLATGGVDLLTNLATTTAKAVAVVVGAFVVGRRLAPWVLNRIAVTQSRELFLLSVVTLALGTAVIAAIAGLSFAFGAFLAGLVIAETDFRTRVAAEIIPFRDLFASLFFVSIGMLIDPINIVAQLGVIVGVTLVTVLGKALIVTAIALGFGVPGRSALLAGLSLAQVGEFSFVLGRLGVDSGALPQSTFDLTLVVAVATIVLSTPLLHIAPWLCRVARRAPIIGSRFVDRLDADPDLDALRGHTVVCGYGRVGHELIEALHECGQPVLVIDLNPWAVAELRAQGTPVIHGDAATIAVLDHAHLDTAAVLAVLIPERSAAEFVVEHARAAWPNLDIVVRARETDQIQRYRRLGVGEIVQPEFEAGVEVIRHVLRHYGLSAEASDRLAEARRTRYYQRVSPQTDL